MKISQLGEFGLIERIRKKTRKLSGHPETIAGIGDDCAVVKCSQNGTLLFTTDTLIEDIHFSRKYCSFFDIGYKSLAVNLSDIAAMGGVPLYCLVTVALPSKTTVKDTDNLYHGIAALASEFNVQLIGGDTVKSPSCLMVSVTAIGKMISGTAILRSGAKAGDLIFTTGTFGDSAAGLLVLQKNISGYRELIRKHLRPYPRVKEGLFIAKSKLSTSMIDSSDGFDKSINLICQESNVGCEIYIDKIPVSKCLIDFTTRYSLLATPYFLFGGEEYELIFTVPSCAEAFFTRRGMDKKFHFAGRITKHKEIVYIDSDNKRLNFKNSGYDHFKK